MLYTEKLRHITLNLLSAFKEIVIKGEITTEKYMAMKNNTELKFQARWQPYINVAN